MIHWSLLVFGCLLAFRHGAEAAVTDTICTPDGNQCASIANSHCSGGICFCALIATENVGTNTCPLTVCTADADCTATAGDPNSECSATSRTCTCTATHYLDGADEVALCAAKTIGVTCALGECMLAGQVCDNTLASPVCACAEGFKDVSGTCTEHAVGDTCTASGYECKTVSNGFCGPSSQCECGSAFTRTGCVGFACVDNAECIALDANSECDGSFECACKANYAISLNGTSGDCQPGVGAACTASGSECQYLLGGYCDTTASPVCACADIMPANGAVCETTSCTANSTCTVHDANSECVKETCMCKSGYELDGTSKSCVATDGSNAMTSSVAVMLMSLLVSVLQY